MKRFLISAISVLFVFSLAGCGGGGGASNGDTSEDGTPNDEVANPVTYSVTYKLAIQGDISSNAVKGIEFEVVLPADVTLKYDSASGIPLPGIVETSPLISTSQPFFASIFSPETSILKVGLFTVTGIGSGEFATVICDVPPGSPDPEARNVKATDVLGNSTVILNGVNVLISN